MTLRRSWIPLVLSLVGLVCALPGFAYQPPEDSNLLQLQFRAPELDFRELSAPAADFADPAVRARLRAVAPAGGFAHVDLRTGRFTNLTLSLPLLPGKGYGNRIAESAADRALRERPAELGMRAWQALRPWLVANSEALGIDVAELVDSPRVTVIDPDFIQIYSPRRVAGIPVRGAIFTATIRYGNLVQLGTSQWGNVEGFAVPRLSADEAGSTLARFVSPFDGASTWKVSELVWMPVSTETSIAPERVGEGIRYRLAWVVRPTFGEADGRYEAVVDANDGAVLAIEDTRQFVASPRVVEGGVLPVSNDGIAPDGVEQLDWPMPFANVTTPGGVVTTDGGGNLPVCVDGSISTALTGKYMTMVDNCGAISLSGTGDLDFGGSAGTDCTTPGTGGAGNTHASRSGFFELNQIKAMARGQLPNNTWLQDNLTSNMNINLTCNAFWNGAAVNFYRSGGGCFNTGELAGVFDHEWGHGMDNNDAVPTIASPGEGIADIYASLRYNNSCIGRHFRASNCSGYGNACTACTGVRDIDWAKHTGNTPFTLTNADACSAGNSNGPCGGSVHCEGQVYSQAVWDLWNRDLVGAPFNYSLTVAREQATQLTYRGASGVNSWFACTAGTAGCSATSGYQQYLVADDDNGNLADGTPHMAAIFAAFNRHGIACATPTVTTAGCSGTPTEVPTVTAVALDRGVALSWTASTGATEYRVYRTEGVFQCSFGKELIATVSGLSFKDGGLKNGREYYYQVIPVGAQDECFSVASSCTNVTPAAGASVSVLAAQATKQFLTGDGDAFIDNCETVRVTVPVSNVGVGSLTNLRIVNVTSPSHPSSTFVSSFPVAVSPSLASCGSANAVFDFVPGGVNPGESVELEVEVTSDELGVNSTFETVVLSGTEGDLQHFASKTFGFEADAEGWLTTAGTFQRDTAGGGGNATAAYMRSSTFLDNQCDVVQSPVVVLAADSTMTLFNNFSTEAFSSGQWWDRANIGIRPVGSATRTLVTPSAGRAYNASGTGGTCGTDLQGGWAGANATWASSTWNAAALQSGTFAGQLVQLETRYGTDSSVNNFGFRFDEVTLTNIDMQIADAQSNACVSNILLIDGFNGGDTSAWSSTVP